MSDQNISRYRMYSIKRKVEPELSAVISIFSYTNHYNVYFRLTLINCRTRRLLRGVNG